MFRQKTLRRKSQALAKMIERAVEKLLVQGNVLTPDFDGSAKVYEIGDIVVLKDLEREFFIPKMGHQGDVSHQCGTEGIGDVHVFHP